MNNGTTTKEAPTTGMVVSEKLMDLTDEMARVVTLVEEEMEKTGGEIIEGAPSEALVAQLDALNIKVTNKADSYAAVIKHFENKGKEIGNIRKDENNRMMKREKAAMNRGARLRFLLEFAMKRLNLRTISGLKYDIAIVPDGGAEPMKIHDKVALPEKPGKFVKVSYSWDMDALRTALAGNDPKLKAAAAKIAEILPRGEHLVIR